MNEIEKLKKEVRDLRALVGAICAHFSLNAHTLLRNVDREFAAYVEKQRAVNKERLAWEEESLARTQEYKRERGIAESFMLKVEKETISRIENLKKMMAVAA